MAESILLNIQGCPVYFPHKAYPSQMSMMNRIVQALNKKENCLLESPTGSGKTLALLCSTLSWLKREIDREQKAHDDSMRQAMDPEDCCSECRPVSTNKSTENETNPIVIRYSDDEAEEPKKKRARLCDSDDDDFQKKSLRSFRDNVFTTKMDDDAKPCNIPCEDCSCHIEKMESLHNTNEVKLPKIFYTSRTHNQIEQVVKEMKRTHYSNMRTTVLSSRDRTCVNDQVRRKPDKNNLCLELIKDDACPHWEKVKGEHGIRTHNILKNKCNLKGAWDIEDLVQALEKVEACPYYVARELMESADIIFAPYNYIVDPLIRSSIGADTVLKNSIIIFDEAHNIESSCMESTSFDIKMEHLESAKKDLLSLITLEVKSDSHRILLNLVENMMTVMELAKPRLIRQDFDAAHLTWTGQEIVALMDRVGIGPTHLSDVRKHFAKVIDENDRGSIRNRMNKQRTRMETATAYVFECLFLILGYIFDNNMLHRDDYYAALAQTTEYSRNEDDKQSMEGMWLGKRRSQPVPRLQERQVLTLSFWCMNPNVAFKSIGKVARSVILTSGTLSPLDSFASELGVEFPVRLEANHVVKNDQTLIGTLGYAPSGGLLHGNYQNYMTYKFQDDLGNLILSLCRMVPHGVLCFVPSYHLVEKFVERWEDTGLMEQLRKVKEVVLEPRRAAEMSNVVSEFYSCIRDKANRGRSDVSGAFLLAVCRGKMSEGQDFSDDYARLVITVGIPYPSIKEPRIKLKRSFNDKRKASGDNHLSGSDWYEVQAFRALNQALGRCIRHRYDWGAILMVDTRLCGDRFMPRVSKWLRQRVHHYRSYGELSLQMEEFIDGKMDDNGKSEREGRSDQKDEIIR